MELFDIENCLKSMEILVDTREQPGDRAEKRYRSFSVPYHRQTLDFGDYTYNFTLPDGKPLYEADTRVQGHCVIERKADLVELSQCLCQSRERFGREFQRAKESGAKVYLLVENANWENLLNGRYGTKFHPAAYSASLLAFMARYDISLIFCKSETSGRLIHDILYRELKERLESGFYG